MEEETLVKTLGLYRDTRRDQFIFKVQVPESGPDLTKRNLLSEVSKIFDPMGWLAPVVIRSKILMEDVWKEKIEWDERPTQSIQSQWQEF